MGFIRDWRFSRTWISVVFEAGSQTGGARFDFRPRGFGPGHWVKHPDNGECSTVSSDSSVSTNCSYRSSSFYRVKEDPLEPILLYHGRLNMLIPLAIMVAAVTVTRVCFTPASLLSLVFVFPLASTKLDLRPRPETLKAAEIQGL